MMFTFNIYILKNGKVEIKDIEVWKRRRCVRMYLKLSAITFGNQSLNSIKSVQAVVRRDFIAGCWTQRIVMVTSFNSKTDSFHSCKFFSDKVKMILQTIIKTTSTSFYSSSIFRKLLLRNPNFDTLISSSSILINS